jgi:hypothetical protein
MSPTRSQTSSRSRSRRAATLFAFLVLALVSTAQAQLWQGPAALEIRAEGQGRDAAGGTVELVYLDLDPPAGPPPVTLDNRGRAVVGGLAEGMWRVSVSREGYMTYQAEVEVRRDDKPELVATFQQNVPGAKNMMKVRINRARPTGDPAPPPQIAQRPAPAPAPRPAPRETPPTAPEPEPQPEPEPEEVPAAPAPAPVQAPTQTPAPTPPMPEPEQPQPRPEPEPTPAPTRPAPITPPVPAPSTPPPPPPESIELTPAPAPVPAPPTSTVRRSYADRTCYECKPGESSLSVERVVPAGGTGCGTGVRDILVGNWQPATGLPAGCGVLQVTLPPGVRYTGYRYEAQGRSEPADCMAGQDCPGGGRWPVNPIVQRGETATTVSAAFENPGSGDERRAVLTVYYVTGEPSGARPRP